MKTVDKESIKYVTILIFLGFLLFCVLYGVVSKYSNDPAESITELEGGVETIEIAPWHIEEDLNFTCECVIEEKDIIKKYRKEWEDRHKGKEYVRPTAFYFKKGYLYIQTISKTHFFQTTKIGRVCNEDN